MKAKLSFLAGATIGYVLGTRAGRESYEKIKSAVKAAWSKDAVQETVSTVQDTVKAQAGEVAHKLVQQIRPSDGSASSRQATPAQPDIEEADKRLYGEGGNPLDIASGVSDEFPDAGLTRSESRRSNNPGSEPPATGA